MTEINLNKYQEEAVRYDKKRPLLIEAGPGSGKTRVIIERVKFLLNKKNIDPKSLLVITFTRKAANELMERLIESKNGLEKEVVNKMQISTIHSFCSSLLSNYSISYDTLEEESNIMFVYKNLRNLGFKDEKTFKKGHVPQLVSKYNELTSFKVDLDKFENHVKENFPVGENYIDFINEAIEKNESEFFSFPQKEVKENGFKDDWYNARYNQIAESYRRYLKLLESEGKIDFALLQVEALKLLESNPQVKESLKYKNILIDEFQDTDTVQMKIFEILMENTDSFTVVGDDEQSIYAFRGSSVKFFKNFQENYDAEVKVLETNYRSTEDIVKFSENFIKEDRLSDSTKSLHADPEHKGPKNSIYHLYNQDKEDEAYNVVKLIKYLKESGKIANYSEVGILNRGIAGKKILSLVKNLREENIPYDVVGNHDLLDKWEIKSLLLLFYYLIEGDKEPYIKNRWSDDWLNISGFCSDDLNSSKMINLSQNTKNILLKLEEDYKNQLIETEKEVYKEFTGKSSRLRSFKGIFNRDEDILIEIFNRVEKPYLWKFTVEDLISLGVKDYSDLEFFDNLYNLRKKIQDEINTENIKYEDKTTILTVFYNLLNISGYLDTKFVDDEINLEELGNLGIISHTLFNFEDIITRLNLNSMFWFLYHNIENYDSKTIDEGDEVQIMTVHKSKGLEFPVVIVYGLQEDVFPSKFKNDEEKLTGIMGVPLFPVLDEFCEYRDNLSIEEKKKENYIEERRILYVAMTRAEDILILSTRLNKAGNMPDIKGIDFNPISIPELNNDFSILPKTQRKRIKNEEEPVILSYSSLKSYKTCPFKYKLKHDLLFAEPESIYIKKGNLVHKILNKTHQRLKNNEKVDIDDLIEIHSTDEEKEKNKKEIENIKKYVEKDIKEFKVLESELPFQIEENGYILEGQIDLIYQRNGKIGIMDFKTSSKFNEKETKRQLFMYLMALKENSEYCEKIDELSIYLVNSQKIHTYPIDEEYLKDLQKNIRQTAKDINKNDFERKHSNNCKSCTFNFICEEKEKVDYEEKYGSLIKKVQEEKERIKKEEKRIKKEEERIKKEKEEKNKKERLRKERLEKEMAENEILKEEKEKLEREIDDEERIKEEINRKERLKKEIYKTKNEKFRKEKFEERIANNLPSLESYEKEIKELEEIYNKKEAKTIDLIEKITHFSKITHFRYLEPVESLNKDFNKIKDEGLIIIEFNKVNNLKIDDELENIINRLKSLLEQIEKLNLQLAIKNSKGNEKSYIDQEKYTMESVEKLINQLESENKSGKIIVDEKITEKTDINNDLSHNLPLFETYENEINELKSIFQEKEKITKDLIKKCFTPPQITYDRYMDTVKTCVEIFSKKADSSITLMENVEKNSQMVDEELKRNIKLLKTFTKNMDKLHEGLAIKNSRGDDFNNKEIEYLVKDMKKLSKSVKDYK